MVKRRGHQDMAFLPAEELESLRATAHLLRSPRNARRLLEAIARAAKGKVDEVDVEDLRKKLGLIDKGR